MTWPTPVAERLGRRLGLWRYVHGCGWQFAGTNIVIDKTGGPNGAWYVTTAKPGLIAARGGCRFDPASEIDQYLDSAMEWVEKELVHYVRSTHGQKCGNCGLIHSAHTP